MVNQELLKWIKTEEAQGYKEKQLKGYLVKKGWPVKEVDEALDYAKKKNIYPPTSKPTSVKPSSGGIKRRNVFLVILFSIITFGIYTIYWIVSTTNELRRSTSSAPNPWLLLLMLVPVANFIAMIIYYWKYSKAINELTGFSAGLLFVLWLLINPVAMILAQIELNKKVG
jgi:hypothetical protein